jgi:hypothetical protein
MNEPKFTPGPWKLQNCSHGGKILIRESSDSAYHQQGYLQIIPAADAYLMAAAPELYRELALKDPDNPFLAKARGEL